MKISPINLFRYNYNKNNFQKKTKNSYQNNTITSYPNLNYYSQLFFTGGKSLDLLETYKIFKTQNQQGNDITPCDIIDMISNELKSNPDTTKTLADIHRQKYQKLNDCFDLDSVKSNFEEFKDVLSDREIEFQDDSFFAKAKRGEIQGLNKDEDLSLQLLKLYWAEGLSLNDLKKEFNANLYYTMKKLNIPIQNTRYAKILKLSDKEYNEHYTQILAQKIKEAKERAIQKSEGEPVYIPRGPLSEEHKRHISEGLLKYYSENPQQVINLSNRQKEYYDNNPEQKIRMQKVMTYAWHGNSHGNSVLKHIRKYFKKMNVEFNNPESFSFEEKTPQQKKTFKDFWDKNQWAKKEFALAVKAGWQKLKKEEEVAKEIQSLKEVSSAEDNTLKPILRIIPQEIIEEALEKAKGTGILETLGKPELDLSDYQDTEKMTEEELRKRISQIHSNKKTSYDEFDSFVSWCTVCSKDFGVLMAISMISISNDLLINKKYCYSIAKDKSFYNGLCAILAVYRKPAFANTDFKPNEAIECYVAMGRYAKAKGNLELFDYIEQMINKTYKLYKEKNNTPQGTKKLHDFMGIKD